MDSHKIPDPSQDLGIVDRTIINIRSVWRGFSLKNRVNELRDLRPDLKDRDEQILQTQMQECLEGKGGEVSARSRAAQLGEAYLNLNDIGRTKFLAILEKKFDINADTLAQKAMEMSLAQTEPQRQKIGQQIRELSYPPRLKLLTQFNALPQGIRFLVDMRADLRRYMHEHTRLKNLDLDLQTLLRSWFDIGFLDLKRITWDEPASLLEKLITYEAVHKIRSWRELKQRLRTDRRCYAFFHPRMPKEPLIFVQVALVEGMSNSIHTLLDDDQSAPANADTAIFYSISNTQSGLQGVSFGNFLIKRVVELLSHDKPELKTFATLSPVPGFMSYLASLNEATTGSLLTHQELDALNSHFPNENWWNLINKKNWFQDPTIVNVLQTPLLRLCSEYLLKNKHRGRASDAVANFHLNNGARLERLNWLADISKKGIEQSAGIMVNYLYRPKEIEKNHERYRSTGHIVASKTVRELLNTHSS